MCCPGACFWHQNTKIAWYFGSQEVSLFYFTPNILLRRMLGSQHRTRCLRPLQRGAKDAAGSPVLRYTKTFGSSPETGLFNKWDKTQKLRVYTLFAWLSLPSSSHPPIHRVHPPPIPQSVPLRALCGERSCERIDRAR